MIIDSHTHTFPDSLAPKVIPRLQALANSTAYLDGTDASLMQSMKQADIALSVQLPVATSASQVEKLNDIAQKKNESYHQTGLFSLGCMHPEYASFSQELQRIAANGLSGIKLHPAYQGVDLDDIRFLRIIEKAAELDLAVVIHAGLDIGIMHHNFADVKQIEAVLTKIAPQKFILAHMGGWKDWDTVEKELCGEKVYFDTSFSIGSYSPPKGVHLAAETMQMLTAGQFERMVKKHSAQRILFGSDSPWGQQEKSAAYIVNGNFTREQKEQMLFKNAKEIFKII